MADPNLKPSDSAKRSRRMFWGIVLTAAALFIGLIATVIALLFGPSPPISVSKQTTYITSPLRPDGTPDYEEYIRLRWRGEATPQTNGAVPFWTAMWDASELNDPVAQANILKELGMDPPQEEECFQSFYDSAWKERAYAWLNEHRHTFLEAAFPKDGPTTGAGFAPPRDFTLNLYVELHEHVISEPWTRADMPPIAEWVDSNARPFALLHDAAVKPHFYLSSPSLVDGKPESLLAVLLPGAQTARTAARALLCRAMLRLGEGDPSATWDDLHATYRLGRHVAHGFTLVELLVGYAVEGIADRGLHHLLQSDTLDSALARTMLHEYESLRPFPDSLAIVAETERVCLLDAAIQLSGANAKDFAYFDMPYIPFSVDWNVVMAECNALYDQIAAAAKKPMGPQRQAAVKAVWARIDGMQQGAVVFNRVTDVLSLVGRGKRNQVAAGMLVAYLFPAIESVFNAEQRATTRSQLTRLAIALAVYRAEQGEYPDTLEALVPGVLAVLPTDLFQIKPYVYRRTEDGYLLYSVGQNGADDGGSNEGNNSWSSDPVLEGRAVDEEAADAEALRKKIPPGADDMSLRTPPVVAPWPWEAVEAESNRDTPTAPTDESDAR